MFPIAPSAQTRTGVIARAQALNAQDDALGLVFFVICVRQTHRFARAELRKQFFRVELGVGADDVVRRLQNGAGGAVVLFELDHFEFRKVNR